MQGTETIYNALLRRRYNNIQVLSGFLGAGMPTHARCHNKNVYVVSTTHIQLKVLITYSSQQEILNISLFNNPVWFCYIVVKQDFVQELYQENRS